MDRNFRRLLDTLAVLPRDGRMLSTPQILERLKARGHNVDIRTLQRDLLALEKEFGLQCVHGTTYGWRWPKKPVRISLPEMDWPEALSFYLLREYLQDLLPSSVLEHLAPHFREAEEKLKRQFPDAPLKRWPDKVRVVPTGQPLRSPKVARSVRETVTEALLAERQLEIQYRRSNDPEPQTWRIHPLALVQHGRVFYLAVRVFDYEGVRMLALHRIERARVLDEKAAVPKDFSLDRWLQQGAMGFGGEGTVRLVADFHARAGHHLLESPLSEDQRATHLGKDGEWIRFSATVQNTEQLRWWLLGFGDAVKVIKPASLRDDIAGRHRAAAERYGGKTS